MNHPEIWEKYKPHGVLVSELLDQYKNKFNWRADGKDSLMDIGCAGGGITMERILSIMPSSFDRLIGIDISKSMIDYAQETHSQPKIDFKTFDIVMGDMNELPQVDHITSIYVFHLLHDHEKALTNIYNLLKPGGDCFILFVSSFMYYTVYEQLARHPKWSKYIKDVNAVIPPSHYSKNPEFDFEQLLKKCNFSIVEISTRDHILELGGKLKNFIQTLEVFYKNIPIAEYDEFATDFTELAATIFNSTANNKQSSESNVYLPLHHLIAYAKK